MIEKLMKFFFEKTEAPKTKVYTYRGENRKVEKIRPNFRAERRFDSLDKDKTSLSKYFSNLNGLNLLERGYNISTRVKNDSRVSLEYSQREGLQS